MTEHELFKMAKSRIRAAGYTITEQYVGDKLHLICERGEERRAWGVFAPLTCWSEAYRAICGSDFLLALIRGEGKQHA